jgi:hypothetical protein
MKKFTLSLAILGLSIGTATAALADNTGGLSTTVIKVDNDIFKTVIAEVQDKNCKIIRRKEVCPFGQAKFEIHCIKSFSVLACLKDNEVRPDGGDKDHHLTCRENPSTNACKFDSKNWKNEKTVIVKGIDSKGKLELECINK